jgi:inhibitor of cysteine peptidase
LFVIDVSDVTAPTIKGELKMPGFSSYLHPYGKMEGGVQYLI